MLIKHNDVLKRMEEKYGIDSKLADEVLRTVCLGIRETLSSPGKGFRIGLRLELLFEWVLSPKRVYRKAVKIQNSCKKRRIEDVDSKWWRNLHIETEQAYLDKTNTHKTKGVKKN